MEKLLRTILGLFLLFCMSVPFWITVSGVFLFFCLGIGIIALLILGVILFILLVAMANYCIERIVKWLF